MTTDTHDDNDSVPSPCVRNCCLNQDDVCLGCFRTMNEILQWQQSTNTEKQQVLLNCQKRKLSRLAK